MTIFEGEAIPILRDIIALIYVGVNVVLWPFILFALVTAIS
jgi:hypothetical protein